MFVYAVCSQCYSLVKLVCFFVMRRIRSFMWYKCPMREREMEMETLLFLYGSVVICSTMKSCLSFKAVWLLRGGMMKTSICPFHYKNDLQCKITIYSDRMCSLLRGSFVLESSSCTCIQSLLTGFGRIHVILIHPNSFLVH